MRGRVKYPRLRNFRTRNSTRCGVGPEGAAWRGKVPDRPRRVPKPQPGSAARLRAAYLRICVRMWMCRASACARNV